MPLPIARRSPMKKPTPKQVKDCRTELGLTQAQLAEKLGVSARTIRRWEAGTWKPPNFLSAVLEELKETK